MHIEDGEVWLTTEESTHLEVVSRHYGQDDLWQAVRLGNINWLEHIVPDAGFETPLSYENRFLARWMAGCRLQTDILQEPICVKLSIEQIHGLGALIKTALAQNQGQLENFDEYMDTTEKEAQELYGDVIIPGVTDITEEEKQMNRESEYITLLRDIGIETKLADLIDSYLQDRN